MSVADEPSSLITCQACGWHGLLPRLRLGVKFKCPKCGERLELRPPQSAAQAALGPAIVVRTEPLGVGTSGERDAYQLAADLGPRTEHATYSPIVLPEETEPVDEPGGELRVAPPTQRPADLVTQLLAPPAATPTINEERHGAVQTLRRRAGEAKSNRLLLVGVFDFLLSPGVPVRWFKMSVGLAIILALSWWSLAFMSGALLGGVMAASIPAVLGLMLVMIFGAAWSASAWGTSAAILQDTAQDIEPVQNWPEGFFGDDFRGLLLAIVAATLAALPGVVVHWLFRAAGNVTLLAAPLSLWILFPPALLALLGAEETTFNWQPVWHSLKRWSDTWVLFYAESAVLIAVALGLGVWLFLPGVWWKFFLSASVLVGGLIFYFRLLGRLALLCGLGSIADEAEGSDSAD